MKSYSFLRPALLAAGILTLGAATTFGQAAPAAPAAGGGGGGGRGGAGTGTAGIARPIPPGGLPDEALQPPVLNDLEVTEITRTKLTTLTAATKAVDNARAELTKAIFTLPVNAQSIAANVQALVNAETALATGRADTYASIIKGYKELTPEKKGAISRAIGGAPAAGGRGGG
jgi:hypothetical protein